MAKIFSEIEKEINKEIKNKFIELEMEKDKFIKIACGFCVDWVRAYAEKKAFQYNIRVSEKLGLKLREFKHEVDDFCQEVPELVRKELSKKNYWQHYELFEVSDVNPEKFESSYDFGVYGVLILDRGMRLAIGKLGFVLKKYGYLNPDKDSTDQWEQKSGTFCCPFPLKWSKDLSDIAKIYGEKLEEFRKLNLKLSQTIKEEKENNIKMNWY
jgi:hypothetical protein